MKDAVICAICGMTFEVPHRGNRRAKFCSRACWAADWAKRQTGEGNVAKRPGVGAKISAAHRTSGRFVGEQNANWNGGQWYERGYVHVHIGVNQDRRRSHVVWDTAHPDDPIRPGDIIHHMNHIKDDDRPENLMKLRQSDHAKVHDLGHNPKARRGS